MILDVMIKSGLLGAPRASGLPTMTSGATQGPQPWGATPNDVQSCMLGPAVRLAVPAPAATASAGSMLAGTSTDDMQRRMGAAGVGAAAQQAVLGALGRVPSSRAAWPSDEHGTQQARHERAQHVPPQLQQQTQQQSGSQVGSLGSGLPEEPSSPEQHAQPAAPPTSSDDQAEAASQPVQPQQAHISTLAAAAPPMRPGQPPGTAGKPRVGCPGGAHAASSKPGKRRSVTAGRKQTPGLAAAAAAGAAAATAPPGRAAELAERPLLRPDLPPQPLQQRMPEQGLEQQQQQGQQQPETAGEQQQQQEDAPVELPALPPEAGPRPQEPQADGCRHITPQQWREYKAALRRWELRKRAREEAEEELLRPRRRRRPPSPDRRPQTMPPVVPGSAAALLREQHEAFAALAEGRRGRGGGLRRAAAMRGAQRISAIASGLVGKRRGVGGVEEEEVEHPADMDSLRASAPHLIQASHCSTPLGPCACSWHLLRRHTAAGRSGKGWDAMESAVAGGSFWQAPCRLGRLPGRQAEPRSPLCRLRTAGKIQPCAHKLPVSPQAPPPDTSAPPPPFGPLPPAAALPLARVGHVCRRAHPARQFCDRVCRRGGAQRSSRRVCLSACLSHCTEHCKPPVPVWGEWGARQLVGARKTGTVAPAG